RVRRRQGLRLHQLRHTHLVAVVARPYGLLILVCQWLTCHDTAQSFVHNAPRQNTDCAREIVDERRRFANSGKSRREGPAHAASIVAVDKWVVGYYFGALKIEAERHLA